VHYLRWGNGAVVELVAAITRPGGCPAALIWIIIDIFRSHDLGGWAKAGWLLLVLVLPFIRVFAYVVTRVARCTSGWAAAPA
jgi:hypothetical protein